MSKKCIEEFNPWPPFVDIFSSTILVLLLFMLILIVNIGYYAQFKFKISYTGTVTSENLILNDNPSIVKQDQRIEEVSDESTIQKEVMEKSVQEQLKEKTLLDLETAGKELDQINDTDSKGQGTIVKDTFMVINFSAKEIILDDIVINQVKDFVKISKEKFPNHRVFISSFDPLNQISATIAKQISLARTLNTRNLIRKLDYERKDVNIKLVNAKNREKIPENESGYVMITIRAVK